MVGQTVLDGQVGFQRFHDGLLMENQHVEWLALVGNLFQKRGCEGKVLALCANLFNKILTHKLPLSMGYFMFPYTYWNVLSSWGPSILSVLQRSMFLLPAKRAKQSSPVRHRWMDESGVRNKKRNILIPNLSVRSSSVNAMDHVDVDVGESFSKCEKLKKDRNKQTNKTNPDHMTLNVLQMVHKLF